eukprot:GHVR01171001.1.p1 GENE.GHVR01171001.1~~GHVR01171001.1.p1  ORF type:complete len:230 (+),score=130.92 GHVR01171001.1:24-713(+)
MNDKMNELYSDKAAKQAISSSDDGRVLKHLQQRSKLLEASERKKEEIEKETKKRKLCVIDDRYEYSGHDRIEEVFKNETIGLVSNKDFKLKRLQIKQLLEEEQIKLKQQQSNDLSDKINNYNKTIILNKNKNKIKLSFTINDDDEHDDDIIFNNNNINNNNNNNIDNTESTIKRTNKQNRNLRRKNNKKQLGELQSTHTHTHTPTHIPPYEHTTPHPTHTPPPHPPPPT